MSREIPEAVRAVAGLAATVLDEARKLPQSLPGLPIRVLGIAMQWSMKLQQHYAGLVARGDELFTGMRGEKEPGLATFDDDEEPAVAAPVTGIRESAFDRVGDSRAIVDVDEELEAETSEAVGHVADDVALQDEATAEVLEEFAIDELVEDSTVEEAAVTEDADAVENALLASDTEADDAAAGSALAVDVLTTEGEVETTEGAVTDEGVAVLVSAAEAAEPATAEPAESAPAEVTAAAGSALDEAVAEAEAGPEAETGEPTEAAAAEAATSEGTPSVVDTAGDAEASARAAAAAPIVVHEGETAVDDALGSGGPEPAAAEDAAEAPAEGGAGEPAPGDVQQNLEAPLTAPVDGYDDFSVAQLRGHLRGYTAPTVQQLLRYEQATLSREPYLRMLGNRLEKLAEG